MNLRERLTGAAPLPPVVAVDPKPVTASTYQLVEPHGPTLVDGEPVPWAEVGRPEVLDHPFGGGVRIVVLEVGCSTATYTPSATMPGRGWWTLDGIDVPWHITDAGTKQVESRKPKEGSDLPIRMFLPVLICPPVTPRLIGASDLKVGALVANIGDNRINVGQLKSDPVTTGRFRMPIAHGLLTSEEHRRTFVAAVRFAAAEAGLHGRVRFSARTQRAGTYWIEVHP